MKKYLLAGTSAFALALTAGAANAQSAPGKFDIKISGDAYFEAGMVSKTLDRDASLDAHGVGSKNSAGDFINRFRLTINPEAKADNGLAYGAVVRIRANSSAGTVDGDRAYIYASGAFGSAQAGVTAGPSDNTYVGHPMDWQMLGAYDQWKYYVGTAGVTGANFNTASQYGAAHWAWGQLSNGASTTGAAPASEGMQLLRSHELDTKVVYYTPRFFGSSPTTGLQGAVSYTPHVGDSFSGSTSVNTGVSRSLVGATPILDSAGNAQQVTMFHDVYELTANYNEKFGDWMVKASLGYEGGRAQKVAVTDVNTFRDLSALQVGVQVGYRDFIIGGGVVDGFRSGYRKSDNTAGTADFNSDMISWNIGAQYTYGPAVVGVKYLAQSDAGNLKTAGGRTLNSLTAGGMYTVAPGLRTGLEYTYFTAKNETGMVTDTTTGGTATKDSGSVVMLRSVVSF